MTTLNVTSTRERLQNFQFHELFIEELGWFQPSQIEAVPFTIHDDLFERQQIAQLGGVAVFQITSADGKIPSAATRREIQKEIARHYHENLIIFIDNIKTQSLWYWIKREEGKQYVREHYYFKGQPGDLFLSKLSAMVVDIGDLDENGDIHVTEAVGRLKAALDIERVIKRFYTEYTDQRLEFTKLIQGIKDERDRKWFASIILNRLMFIYFLQRKYFINNGDADYLQKKLEESKEKQGKNKYFEVFLQALFFEGFAKPEGERSETANKLLGKIKYLNGGLFIKHRIEIENENISIPDKAFENLFSLFKRYSWNLGDTPGGSDNEMNPDVLGYIFEKYINQKAFGAYYTRTEITEYLCERTIYKLILDKVNSPEIPGVMPAVDFKSISELLMNLDAKLCRQLLLDILPRLSLLDPACGSGAFLVAAMKTLINLYAAIIGRIEFLNDRNLTDWLRKTRREHPSINYFIKKRVITDNLYGVDIMEEATEIARLRLFLALVASAQSVEELEPLPNIDFNILPGNSLIGLMRLPTKEELAKLGKQQDLFSLDFHSLLEKKNRLVDDYKHAGTYAEDLGTLKENIEKKKKDAQEQLNELLLKEFKDLGIKFEQATWDDKKHKQGKSQKRDLSINDIEKLKPFHWGYEFDEIVHKKEGFDAIITNPPWEIFKPNGKEFFEEYSDLVTKKKMTINEFKIEKRTLLKDREVLKVWLEYLSEYPHVNQFFRSSIQYQNQISLVGKRTAGTDINLYKTFIEQCYNLLCEKGECGLVVPSGIHTDLGAKGLRVLLFNRNEVTGLFGFENRKEIFENVHRSFKFDILTYKKGASTVSFPARFMRHEVKELSSFPQEKAVDIEISLVNKTAPGTLSVIEFKSDADIKIINKMMSYPILSDESLGNWKVEFHREFHREFHMTDDSHLFRTNVTDKKLPLFEGKMIWQFDHRYDTPRFWINESEGRKTLTGSGKKDLCKMLGYQKHRLAYRAVASNTNERTLICTIVPKTFTGNSINVCDSLDSFTMLYSTAVLNSYPIDWLLRLKVSANLNMFYLYQLPVPRLSKGDPYFSNIVELTAQLICISPEFNNLAKEVGLGSHKNGVTDPVERAKLRAELDGIIAHLYELTEDEFAYILTTFPLVADSVKVAARNAYRDVEKGLIV